MIFVLSFPRQFVGPLRIEGKNSEWPNPPLCFDLLLTEVTYSILFGLEVFSGYCISQHSFFQPRYDAPIISIFGKRNNYRPELGIHSSKVLMICIMIQNELLKYEVVYMRGTFAMEVFLIPCEIEIHWLQFKLVSSLSFEIRKRSFGGGGEE